MRTSKKKPNKHYTQTQFIGMKNKDLTGILTADRNLFKLELAS